LAVPDRKTAPFVDIPHVAVTMVIELNIVPKKKPAAKEPGGLSRVVAAARRISTRGMVQAGRVNPRATAYG